MAMRRVTLVLAAFLCLCAPAQASMSIPYAKRALSRYISRHYDVVRGPYFSHCVRLGSSWVRCDVDFRAGLFDRCARGSVKTDGRYDYISFRAPIC